MKGNDWLSRSVPLKRNVCPMKDTHCLNLHIAGPRHHWGYLKLEPTTKLSKVSVLRCQYAISSWKKHKIVQHFLKKYLRASVAITAKVNILKYRVNTSNSRYDVEKLNGMRWDARVFILSAVSVTYNSVCFDGVWHKALFALMVSSECDIKRVSCLICQLVQAMMTSNLPWS